MSFPTIPTVGAGRVLSSVQANTTATRTFPDLSGLTKNPGDLLLAIIVGFQSNTTANAVWSGWTGGFSECVDLSTATSQPIGAAWKISDGTETGTISVTQAAIIQGHAAMFLLSIPMASPVAPEGGGYASNAGGGTADPASFDPSFGVEDLLWIAVGASGEANTTGSYTGIASGPANFSDYVDSGMSADAAGAVESALAFRQLNAGSLDVGTFSVDTSNARNAVAVIAVRGSIVVSAGIATVSHSIPAGQVLQTYAAGIASVSHSVPAGKVLQTYPAGVVSEQVSIPAGSVVQPQVVNAGVVAEQTSVLAGTVLQDQVVLGGVANEQDSVPSGSVQQIYSAGTTSEQMSVPAGQVLQTYTAGVVSEQSSVPSGQVQQIYAAGVAQEETSVPPGHPAQVYQAGSSAEEISVPQGQVHQVYAAGVAPEETSIPAGQVLQVYTSAPVTETIEVLGGQVLQIYLGSVTAEETSVPSGSVVQDTGHQTIFAGVVGEEVSIPAGHVAQIYVAGVASEVDTAVAGLVVQIYETTVEDVTQGLPNYGPPLTQPEFETTGYERATVQARPRYGPPTGQPEHEVDAYVVILDYVNGRPIYYDYRSGETWYGIDD